MVDGVGEDFTTLVVRSCGGEACSARSTRAADVRGAAGSYFTAPSPGLEGPVRIWSNGWAIIQFLPRDLASFMKSH